MRYVKAKHQEKLETYAYRIYITDSLYYQGEDKRLTIRYTDLINRKDKKVDNRTGDEIALDVIAKLGLKEKENECI